MNLPLNLYSAGSFSLVKSSDLLEPNLSPLLVGIAVAGRTFSSCLRNGLRMIGILCCVNDATSRMLCQNNAGCRSTVVFMLQQVSAATTAPDVVPWCDFGLWVSKWTFGA